MTTTTRHLVTLRGYQEEALAAIADAETRNIQRPLVALPTGTGKTIIFAHQTADSDGDTLILVHRDELARQTVEKLHMVAPELHVGIVKAEQDEHNAHVVVASVQTLSRANRLARRLGGFKQIIIDEAHHAVADTYQRIIEHFGGFEAGGPQVIGFTATPERGDKVNLKHVWQEIVYSKDILSMIRAGYLVDLKGKRILIDRFNLDNVKRQNGDWQDAALADEMRRVHAPNKIADGYVEFGQNRPSLCFTPTVAIAYDIRDALKARGVTAEMVEANTPIDERQQIYAGLRAGTVKVVVNCGVLTEGFDEPSVSCIMMCRPTNSKPLYIQCIGRGTRTDLRTDKQDCLVLDFCGVSSKHEITTLSQLFDLTPKDLANGATVLEAVDAKEARIAAFKQAKAAGDIFDTMQDGELEAKNVDLFNRKQIHWIPTNDGGYIVSIESGTLQVNPASDGLFEVRIAQAARNEVLASDVTLELAQGIAEDQIRANGWIGLAKKDTGWRQRFGASDRQIWKLSSTLGRRLTEVELARAHSITQGEMSDWIAVELVNESKRKQPAAAAQRKDWW